MLGEPPFCQRRPAGRTPTTLRDSRCLRPAIARFLRDLIEKAKPQYLGVAFDESLTTSFRNRIYPAYKANREPATTRRAISR